MKTVQSLAPWQLRALRLEMEEEFVRVMRTMSNGESEGSSQGDGPWSPAARSESVQLAAVLHEGAQDRLNAITAALRRLDAGAYGDCTKCGTAISFGRLSVMPETTLCVACGAM